MEKLPKSWRYKSREKAKMLKSGFPLCYENRHCKSCIGLYRNLLKKAKCIIIKSALKFSPSPPNARFGG